MLVNLDGEKLSMKTSKDKHSRTICLDTLTPLYYRGDLEPATATTAFVLIFVFLITMPDLLTRSWLVNNIVTSLF